MKTCTKHKMMVDEEAETRRKIVQDLKLAANDTAILLNNDTNDATANDYFSTTAVHNNKENIDKELLIDVDF